MASKDHYIKASKVVGEFADTVWDSYRAIFESALATQERNMELTLNVFESGMETVERGVEINRRVAQELARRMRKQREMYEEISRESNDAYEGFVGSLSDYYREVSNAKGPGNPEG